MRGLLLGRGFRFGLLRGLLGFRFGSAHRFVALHEVAVFDELRQSVKEIEFLANPSAGELRVGFTEVPAGGIIPVRSLRIIFSVVATCSAALEASNEASDNWPAFARSL